MHGGARLADLLLEGSRGARRLRRSQPTSDSDERELTARIDGTEVLLDSRNELVAALLEELAVNTSTYIIHKPCEGVFIVCSHRLGYLLAVLRENS